MWCDSGKCSKIPSDTSGSNFLPCPLSDHCADDHHNDDDELDDDYDEIFTLSLFLDLIFSMMQATFVNFPTSDLYLTIHGKRHISLYTVHLVYSIATPSMINFDLDSEVCGKILFNNANAIDYIKYEIFVISMSKNVIFFVKLY